MTNFSVFHTFPEFLSLTLWYFSKDLSAHVNCQIQNIVHFSSIGKHLLIS